MHWRCQMSGGTMVVDDDDDNDGNGGDRGSTGSTRCTSSPWFGSSGICCFFFGLRFFFGLPLLLMPANFDGGGVGVRKRGGWPHQFSRSWS